MTRKDLNTRYLNLEQTIPILREEITDAARITVAEYALSHDDPKEVCRELLIKLGLLS